MNNKKIEVMKWKIVKYVFLFGFGVWLILAMASTNFFELIKALLFSGASLMGLYLWGDYRDED